jgi:hypothetical protein
MKAYDMHHFSFTWTIKSAALFFTTLRLSSVVSVHLSVAGKAEVALEYNSTLYSSYNYYKRNVIKPNVSFDSYATSMGVLDVKTFRHYNFVFGFSTGHVATGTFTDNKLYSPSINRRVNFVFEGKVMCHSLPGMLRNCLCYCCARKRITLLCLSVCTDVM